MSLLDRVRRANQPGPPEESILFRVSATATVAVAVLACWAQGELAAWVTVGSIALVVAGNVFSYRRRANPPPGLKLLLAVAVSGAFAWFFVSVSDRTTIGDLAAVEGPLAVLFTWIQVTHSFDVPSRRDLGFSLAGSVTLMAVAAAQAVDTTFGVYVAVWAAFGLAGLSAMWSSMAGGEPLRLRSVATSSAAVLAVGLALVWLLPAPRPSSRVVFPSSLAGDIPLSSPGGLVGGGANGAEPLRAGSPSGPDRVGGLLGFAGPLDTAIRGSLGNEVVLRVRADRPSFWLAETFDTWSGRSWTQSNPRGRSPYHELTFGPPFSVPVPAGEPTVGTPDIQTFYLARAGANLIYHAANATQVWFPANRLYVADDGTMRTGTTMGPGSIYTVESTVDTATPDQLRHATGGGSTAGVLPAATRAADTRLPHAYPRVRALAQRITARSTNLYDKITALQSWIGAHTRYTTDIPPLAPGQDTVTEFLFGNRRGYCEQISTALSVMLRSLGIATREATGYVPGSFNPITDLYDVQAKDAHAWVQVWFPGYGWQSFDPTAVVPLANPTPASALTHDLSGVIRQVPVVPVVAVAGVVGGSLLLWRRRRRAPGTWAAGITRELERATHRGGVTVGAQDSLVALAAELDRRSSGQEALVPRALPLAWAAERAAYGDGEPDAEERRVLTASARRLRRQARRLRRSAPTSAPPGTDGEVGAVPAVRPGSPPAPRPTTPPRRAGAGRP